MKDLEVILSLAGTAVGLAITAATLVVKVVRSARAKRIAEESIKICNAILPFIREAEKFTAYSGAEKKAYVMTKALQFAVSNKIQFNEKNVDDRIEELVALTQQVNTKNLHKAIAEITEETKEFTTRQTWL